MNRRILAVVFGFVWSAACGDNAARAITDASTDSSPSPDAPGPDAAMVDAQPDAAVPPDAFVDTSLRLRFDFEELSTVVKDTSGRGLDGTLSDVAAWTADGRTGRAIALSYPVQPPPFQPPTQFVSRPSGVLTGVNDFTISVWVNVKSISVWARIFDFGDGKAPPDDRFMFLTLHGFTPGSATPPNVDNGIHATSFTGAAPAAETFLGTQTQLPLGVWKHITLTGSGGDRKLYIDGFPAASVTGGTIVPPGEMEPLSPNSWLGRSRFPDPGFDGSMDDFRIYNKVLTQPEIADLAWPQRDYSYWRFDEGSGLTTKDSSDNNIATVLVNGAKWTIGRLGDAIDLTGGPGNTAGPHVALASSPLASCTTQFTAALWVKLRTNTNFARIFDFGNSSGTFLYLAATDGTGLHLGMGKQGAPAFDLGASRPVPADNAWHHVAVTIDPTGLVNLYLDGASVATPTPSLERKPSDYIATPNNYLGRSQFTADRYLDGALDELRISCRAFTADEIKNLSRPEPTP
jgi:hypothetical protein